MICIEELVPEDHLLRKIEAAIDFTHIYELVGDLLGGDASFVKEAELALHRLPADGRFAPGIQVDGLALFLCPAAAV